MNLKKADCRDDRRDKNPDCTQEVVGVTSGPDGEEKTTKKKQKPRDGLRCFAKRGPLSSAHLMLKQTAVIGGDYFLQYEAI